MKILEYINKGIDPTASLEDIPFKVHATTIAKNTIITPYEKMEDKIYFLVDGIVEISVDTKAEERIVDFFFNNSFFSSYSSLLTKTKSDVQLKAISKCEVEYFYYSDLLASYSHSLLMANVGRIATEMLYVRRLQKEKEMLTKTAEERYAELLKNHPEFILKIPTHKIARYLGIHPESLSRIKRKLIS